MDILGLLIANIIPLYIIIALGYIAGRWLDVNLPSMATVVIYIVAPVVNFGAMTKLQFDSEYVLLPLIFLICSALIGFITYAWASAVWRDSKANLIAMSSVTGNTGYFGLPIVLALFGEQWVGLYLFMNMGLLLSEVGLGYYFGARGHADVKGAIMKVLKLPVIYAIPLGLIVNLLNVDMPVVFDRYWNYATGAWVIIGMMLIGIALSKQERLELDGRLILWMFVPKFLVWPLVGVGIIAADHFVFHAFEPVIYSLIAIFTSVPLAGNIVAFAANLNLHPERAAGAVLVSTVLGIVTVPAAVLLTQAIF
jgi:hypothetical protein